MAKTPSVKSRAKILKGLGVVSYDLRKKLHPSSQKRIARLWDEWSYVIHHSDDMAKRSVSPKTAKLLKKSGYSVNQKNQVFLMAERGDQVSIRDETIIYRRANGDTEKIILPGRKDFAERVMSLGDKPLERNQLITLKIGEYRNISTQFRSHKEMKNYVERTNWKNKNVFQYISVVTVNVESGPTGKPVFQKRTDLNGDSNGKTKAKRSRTRY
jgi:hypothetical protein